MNDNIKKVALGSVAAFLLLIFYLTYLQVYRAEALFTNPHNKRLQKLDQLIVRGSITDTMGTVLAQTRPREGLPVRVYPQGEAAAHLVGYTSLKFGRTGLESSYNNYLIGLAKEEKLSTYIKNRILGIREGNTLVLTLDMNLQKVAYSLLKGQKGALVALDPATGQVLTLVTSPAFNPNKLEALWPQLIGDPASPLLNRATQGVYPPGSTMKVITGAGALEKDPTVAQRSFTSPGYFEVEGYRLEDTTSGQFSFEEALKYSSNAVFAGLGLALGPAGFKAAGEKFQFEQAIPFDLPVQKSFLPLPKSGPELAEASIGQGKILATPLQMALVTAAIANEGVLMKPYLVKEIRDAGGDLIKTTPPAVLNQVTSPETARIIKAAMVQVVRGGTGKKASLPGIQVAGKTGSAENPHGPPHSWFIGFAPAENPRVAVAVIVENVGSGGSVAAPIARTFFTKALKEVK